MKCKKPNGFFTTVSWRFYYPQCPPLNFQCNGKAGAWVAAVTICNQQLFF